MLVGIQDGLTFHCNEVFCKIHVTVFWFKKKKKRNRYKFRIKSNDKEYGDLWFVGNYYTDSHSVLIYYLQLSDITVQWNKRRARWQDNRSHVTKATEKTSHWSRMALIGGQMYRFPWWQVHNYCLSWHERIIQTFHDSSISLPLELQVFMKWRIQMSYAFFFNPS